MDLTQESVKHFVVVTTSSDDHFEESRGLIAGIQNYYPGKKIIYYDLGLLPSQKEQVRYI